MATIEDVNERTVLQQFHSLYKKQTETDKNVKNLDTKIEQEKSDRQTADANLRNDINTNTNKIEYNATQITALKSDKQDKLTAGANITIDENNVISASGGSKLYQHTCYTAFNQRLIKLIIINNSSAILNSDTIKEYFVNNGFTTAKNLYPIVGDDISGSTGNQILHYVGIFYSTYNGNGNFNVVFGEKELTIQDGKILVNNNMTSSIYFDISYLTDTVVEL